MRIAAPGSTPVGFSRAKSRATYRWTSQPNLNWSSISEPLPVAIGYGRGDWSTKLIRGLTSEAAAGFRSRRGPSHDSTLVTPHNAPFSTYKAPRVHIAAGRGSRVAARGARAAAGDAADRVSQLPLASRVQASGGWVPRGSANVRLRRRSERRDPFPLGRGPIRSPAGDGRRAGSRERSGPGDAWRRALSACGQSSDLDDPDYLQRQRRPGQIRTGREPQPAGRQRHRR